MHFLWNKQVLGFIFILKIQFLFHLIHLIHYWTGPQILEKTGFSVQETRGTEHSAHGPRVG
jgi:hypothetical protein